jgi:YegS/Rv2252/BmrU family lipid kinase
MKVRLVANPNAGGGRARSQIAEVVRSFERLGVQCDVAETSAPGHASELARQARTESIDVVAVLGGDGTFSEAAQAWVDREGRPVEGPALGLIPFGTGGDFRRNFGLGSDVNEAARRIVKGEPRRIDLPRAQLSSHAGESISRCFINVGSFGITGVVAHLVNTSSKHLGGTATFYLSTLRATLGYRNVPVRIRADGELVHEGRTYLGAFANGRFFGGGMQIAPSAALDDGLLDCIVLGDYSRLSAIVQSQKIYDGRHLELSKTKSCQGRHFEVTPWLDDSVALVELDGETPGHLPMTIDVIPGAIELRV